MTKSILLSDHTSHLYYTLLHMTSCLGCEHGAFDLLHLVRSGSSVASDLVDVQADAAKFGCTMNNLDVSRLDPILKGAGLHDLIKFDKEGQLNDPPKVATLLSVVAVHAQKLGYETIVLGWLDEDDHLRDLVTQVNEALFDVARRNGGRPVAFDVYNLD